MEHDSLHTTIVNAEDVLSQHNSDMRSFLRERREEIQDCVAQACAHAGRAVDDVLVMAVSKTVTPDVIVDAYGAGWRTFGENRPQELARKVKVAQENALDVRFDMIGNLQTNKINQVLGKAELIQSVSSFHLAQAISSRALNHDMVARGLLEVNVSGEASKSGFNPEDLLLGFKEILECSGLEVVGLMTMAPQGDMDEARRTFSGLRDMKERLEEVYGVVLDELSCGMSDDFDIAIEEGSTLVRLGRIVFDPQYTFE